MTTLTFDEEYFAADDHGPTLRRAHVPTANGLSPHWMNHGAPLAPASLQNHFQNAFGRAVASC
jgi:hypothetical protein